MRIVKKQFMNAFYYLNFINLYIILLNYNIIIYLMNNLQMKTTAQFYTNKNSKKISNFGS
ncbi:MAG TPA: hypothetical protein DCX92_08705 [Bacteroidetes bacterium]|nr:hypothetical protein [Bacteroidota bacterium]